MEHLFAFACLFTGACFVDGWPGNAFCQFLGRVFGAAFWTVLIAVGAALI